MSFIGILYMLENILLECEHADASMGASSAHHGLDARIPDVRISDVRIQMFAIYDCIPDVRIQQ